MHQVNAVTIEEAKSRLESIRRTLAEINTVGRKGWGKRTRYSKQKAVLTLTYDELAGALKGKLDLKMIRKAIADYGRLKSDFRGMLYKHMRAYDAGEITISQLTSRLKKEIAGHWDEAYVLGTRAVGNPFGLSPEDSAFLKGARTTEYGFLGKFMTAIDTGKEKMARYDRLEMYVQSLDGMYGHGQVDGMPENIEIDWVLHPAEHCSDCLKFAAEGPYTKKTLPAVPRDGTTQCLSGCKCTLRFRKVPLKEPLRPVVVGPKKLRIPPGYRLPEPEEMDVAYSYHNEIVRYRQLIKITKDPKLKREYIRLRRDANKDLIDYLQKKKIYWTPGIELNLRLAGTRESIKEEVKLVLLEGGAGSGHWDHAGRKGERGGSAPGGGLGGGSVEQELAKRFAKQIQKMEGMKAGTEIELGRQVIEGNVINHATLAVYSDGEVLLYGGYFKGAPGDFSKHETAKYVVGNVEPKGGRIGGPPPTDIPDKVPWKKAGKDGAQKALFSKAKITGSKEEVKMVEDTLSQLPENHLSIAGKRVKNIEVADSKTILNEYAKQWPLPYGAEAYGMNGFYDQGTGRLMVTNSKLGLLHEFAHAVHYSSREIVDNIQQKIWRNGGAEGLINDYATTDMAESFAEGYRYFAVQNTDLKSSAPVVWSEMGKMFSKGLKD